MSKTPENGDGSGRAISGRKRGRPKTASSLNDAIYGPYATRAAGLNSEFDPAFIVQDTFLWLGKMPPNPEDYDDNQLELRALWVEIVGDLVVRAILEKDHFFFADIAAILKDNPPDDEGGWQASAPEVAEAFALAAQNPSMTRDAYVEKVAKLQPANGDSRRTVARRAKAAGIESRPRGRPKKKM